MMINIVYFKLVFNSVSPTINYMIKIYKNIQKLMSNVFLEAIIKNIEIFSQQCLHYLALIPEEEIRNSNILQTGNSAWILINHVIGNVQQYVFSAIEWEKDIRQRNNEFKTKKEISKKELIEKYKTTIKKIIKIIQSLPQDERKKKVNVQCFEMSKYGALVSSISHMFIHVGQIIEIGSKFGGNQKYFDKKFNLNLTN